MGKKPQRHDWREAKHLCRLNQDDIAMAKVLGFRPDTLIRARPDPKQKWKLPVKLWIRELHSERFGYVLGEKPPPAPQPSAIEFDDEAARLYSDELYWEHSADESDVAGHPTIPASDVQIAEGITDDDVPF